MTVSSEFYEKYWADFALYWGGWIYAQTFAMIAPELNSLNAEVEDYDLTTFEHSIKLLLSEGGMPILTVQEIAWPFIDARARSEQS